jgi:lantibiotic modifying enzyme
LDRAQHHGWICANPADIESPGLMTGLAGIGYGLLRQAEPDRPPSILTLEGPRPMAP